MLRSLKIRTKIRIAFVFIAVAAVSVIGYLAYSSGKSAHEEEAFKKLTAIREMKAGQIEAYFQLISNQVITLSEDRMTIAAMRGFEDGFRFIASELDHSPSEMEAIQGELTTYYEDEFIGRLIVNLLEDISAPAYVPANETTQILQYLYTASNPNPVGSKHLLDDAGDGSIYSKVHETFHPIISNYLDRFGYYDIFLVDLDGNIVYSVFKEADYGTSLLTGLYSETNFADAYRQALEAEDKNFSALVDFQPYQPSYDAPAAFVASPIYDDDEKIGVLVFQMPIGRIDDIMTSNQQWEDVGLGESGETYILGDDFTLRNQSRFLIEDEENYLQTLKDREVPIPIVARIRSLNTTIGLQQVTSDGGIAALSGQEGEAIFPDYRGVSVLSSYKPLDIAGVNWAIMSEIDETEAFQFVNELGNRTLAFLVFTIVGVIAAATWFSRSITNPLKDLTGYSRALAKHDFGQGEPFAHTAELDEISEGEDEIGELAGAFQIMQTELDESITHLIETTAEKERMESELSIGREIQMSLLPQDFPQDPRITIHAQLVAAREVGGDWYDFFFIDEDRVCFCVGDVAGKGVPGALFMAVAKTLIKSRAALDHSTASIIEYANRELNKDNANVMFATIFIGILDIRTGELLYTNAAHNPPYRMGRNKRIVALDHRHGVMVGPMPGSKYEEEKIVLADGDLLVIFTDGVTEAMNPDVELFSEERLIRLLSSADSRPAEEVTISIFSGVDEFASGAEQSDDITVLVVQYHGGSHNIDDGQFEMIIVNEISEIDRFQSQFAEFAAQEGIPATTMQKVQVVFEDLLSNIIFYAYDGDKDHEIDISMDITGGSLRVTVVDDGLPFNPLEAEKPDTSLDLQDRDIGGLGIHLVLNLMDEVTYERRGEQNVITLTKKIE